MEMIANKYSDFPDDTIITSRQENHESIHRHNAFAEKVTTMGELKQELFNLRFQAAVGKLENTAQLRKVKKEIARAYTVLTERASKEA